MTLLENDYLNIIILTPSNSRSLLLSSAMICEGKNDTFNKEIIEVLVNKFPKFS